MAKVVNLESESYRQSLIIKFLKSIPESRVIRLYNCPPFDPRRNRYMRTSNSLTPNGLPDLLFLSKSYGIHFFEVKGERGYKEVMKKQDLIRSSSIVKKSYQHLKNQISLIDEINTYSAKASFVSTIDHVKKALGIKE